MASGVGQVGAREPYRAVNPRFRLSQLGAKARDTFWKVTLGTQRARDRSLEARLDGKVVP